MANKFTKLNIGEAVASSGGRAWKKLSSMLPLAAPTLSLDGSVLTITENSGLATSFDILVDGEVKYTYAKYLYNGVELPPLPIIEGYPYCWIRNNTTSGYYDLIFYKTQMYYKNGIAQAACQWYRIEIASADTATEWDLYEIDSRSFGIDTARPVLWSSHDIPNGSATATTVYFEGSEPVQSGISLTSAVFDLLMFTLPEGTHNITVISKTEGNVEIAKSEAVSYHILSANELEGNWTINSQASTPFGIGSYNDVMGIYCNTNKGTTWSAGNITIASGSTYNLTFNLEQTRKGVTGYIGIYLDRYFNIRNKGSTNWINYADLAGSTFAFNENINYEGIIVTDVFLNWFSAYATKQ